MTTPQTTLRNTGRARVHLTSAHKALQDVARVHKHECILPTAGEKCVSTGDEVFLPSQRANRPAHMSRRSFIDTKKR